MRVLARGGFADLLAGGSELIAGIELCPRSPGDYNKSVDPVGRARVARVRGQDAFGRFETLTIRRRWNQPGEDASLALSLYPERGALLGTVLPHGRQPLRPQRGLRVGFNEFPGLKSLLALHRSSPFWTIPVHLSSPRAVPLPSQLVWWDAGNGRFAALLPLCGNGMKGELGAGDGNWDRSLGVTLSGYKEGMVVEKAPAFALGVAGDPYDALDTAFDLAAACLPSALSRRRPGVPFPDVLEYLGWCSWNAFYGGVSAKKMLDIARLLKRSGVHVRWMLADVGWADVSHGKSHNGQLWSFEAVPGKFPGGLEPLIAKLKREFGMSWFGVWHAFNGWWNGIDPRGPIARRLRASLISCPASGANEWNSVKADSLMPDPQGGRGEAFYDAWYRELAAKGVDFVKVDNQGSMQATIAGRMPLFDAMTGQHANLVNAVRRHFGGRIIHCMCMSSESAYSWRDVAVARNSDDFIPGQALNHRDHAWMNAYNAPWTSRLAWPDYDMWESRHPHAEFHAVLRAVSGGPVYITDKPGRTDARMLNRLVLPDGRLLRAREPAQPTADCLFTSPHEHRIPLKLFAPAGPGAVIAAFNVHRAGRAVAGSVGPTDAPGLPGSRFAIVEWKTRAVHLLRRSGRVPLELAPDSWAIFMVVPYSGGFAPVGLMEKYLPLAAVTSVRMGRRSAEVLLASGGAFGFYCRRPRAVTAAGRRMTVRRSGDLRIAMVPGNVPVNVSIVW